MRRPLLSIFLIIAISAIAHHVGAAALSLRRVAPAAPPRPAGSPAARTLTAGDEDGLRRRIQRWRARSDLLTGPGVSWSRWSARSREAQRRPGFGRMAPLSAEPGAEVQAAVGPPDTLRVAFIRVDFLTDNEGRGASTGNGKFDLTPPTPGAIPIDRPPRNRNFYLQHLEALHRYYLAQSYGRTVIVGDVYPADSDSAYHVGDMSEFGPWAFNQDIFEAAVRMFQVMLTAADQQSAAQGARIPWDKIDRVILIHAGSDLQSDVLQNSPEDIPSFTLGVDDSDAVVFHDMPVPGDSVKFDRAAVIPETAHQDGYYGAINGVLAHECGHLFFGFADVYNIETGFPVVGVWSLMDSGNLVGAVVELPNSDEIFAVGLLPPSIDPLQRFFATDTLHFTPPREGALDTLRAGYRHPDMRRVLLSSDEYLLLENRALPGDSIVELRQDTLSHVILGPGGLDTLNFDALTPGEGILVWHIDESVAFAGGLRENPDFGVNTNPLRPGISVVEADGLFDLGDPSSALALGSPYDPYFAANNPRLDDNTIPNNRTWSGTRPHIRLDFTSNPDTVMTFRMTRSWVKPGWPVTADFPAEGPVLMAVDVDGNREPDVAWAGGADSLVVLVVGGNDTLVANPDSTALFAVRSDGKGIHDTTAVIYRFPVRPFREAAALPLGDPGDPNLGVPPRGPSLFAVATRPAPADTNAGRVFVVDDQGNLLPGWPARLPSRVTTPPVMVGSALDTSVYVGCADGRVYHLNGSGQVLEFTGNALPAALAGRLALWGGGNPPLPGTMVAAADSVGNVGVLGFGLTPASLWPRALGAPGVAPGLLWAHLDNAAQPLSGAPLCGGGPQLLVQRGATLEAYCASGVGLPGWGQSVGDSLLAGLAVGDVDGDGYSEVVSFTKSSKLAYWDASGSPSPGWPLGTTRESFPSGGTPLAVDADGDGIPEMVALNGSGTLVARHADGSSVPGWPLASGVGAQGSPCFADLGLDGTAEIVVPDRTGRLWAYSLPVPLAGRVASPWTMAGGGPARTYALDPGADPLPRVSASPALLEPGSLKVFPNPARLHAVNFACRLLEPGEVEITILDASGHPVASFTRPTLRADNLMRWDPAGVPAGLYMARLRFRGGGREQVEVMPLGLLR